MRRRALQLLAVCCLVTLAGCTGALPGGSADDGSADEPTLDDVSYPPGVSENGTNFSALSTAHAAQLNGSSFTLGLEVTQNVTTSETPSAGGNSSESEWSRSELSMPAGNQSMAMRAAVGPDRDAVRMNLTGASLAGTPQSMAVYATAEKQYVRIATDRGAIYQATERTPDAPASVPASYDGTDYFGQFGTQAGANFTPTGVRVVNGTTLVVLEANGSDASAADGTTLTRYDATLLVDEQGVIHRFEVVARADRGDHSLDVSASMTVSNVGETTVEEPPWLDEAHNRTSS